MSETPLPNKRKMKPNRIMVTTMDGNYRLHQKAYISQNPFTDHWALRIVEVDPNKHNRVTLYPYNQIREVVMEDEDECSVSQKY